MKAQDNVYVQMMREYLERALAALDADNVPDAATFTRIAGNFEGNIPDNLRFTLQACDAEVMQKLFPNADSETLKNFLPQ